jgi:tetratricopeptide (TPR) repeat protein
MSARDDKNVDDNAAAIKAAALKEKGDKFYDENNFQLAIKKYEDAAQIDPSDAKIWIKLASCFWKYLDLIKARDAFKRAIEVDPSSVVVYCLLARIQHRLWEFEDEKKTIERGLSHDPNNEALQQRKHENERHSKFRSQEVCSTVLDEVPTSVDDDNVSGFDFFGGLHDDGDGPTILQNKIPPNSAYAKLSRPFQSPYTKRIWEETRREAEEAMGSPSCNCNGEDPDKHAFFAIDVFCNQKLLVKWHSSPRLFQLEGYMPDDDVHPVIVYVMEMNETIELLCSDKCTTEPNQLYHKSLTSDQRNGLKLVLISRFLRSLGSVLPIDTLLKVYSSYKVEMVKRESHKGLVDIELIVSDVMYNCHMQNGTLVVPNVLVRLGEALEAAKMYNEAANVYLDLAKGTFGPTEPNAPKEVLHGHAALAFKRDMNYVSAEREYITSLHLAGENLPLRDTSTVGDGISPGEQRILDIRRCNLQNTMIFYEIAHRAVLAGLKTDQAHKDIQLSFALLSGLLSNAGYSCQGCTVFGNKDNLQKFKKLLKPKYRQQRHAERAVRDAISKNSIEDFRRALFACKKPGEVQINQGENGYTADGIIMDQKEKAKSGARQCFTANQVGGLVRPTAYSCDYCGDTSTKTKLCQCNRASYCSTKCQSAHRTIHKQTCTARRSSAETKNNKKK